MSNPRLERKQETTCKEFLYNSGDSKDRPRSRGSETYEH